MSPHPQGGEVAVSAAGEGADVFRMAAVFSNGNPLPQAGEVGISHQVALVGGGPAFSGSDVDFQRDGEFVWLLHTVANECCDFVDFVGGSFED
jgi:hypothetical protein